MRTGPVMRVPVQQTQQPRPHSPISPKKQNTDSLITCYCLYKRQQSHLLFPHYKCVILLFSVALLTQYLVNSRKIVCKEIDQIDKLTIFIFILPGALQTANLRKISEKFPCENGSGSDWLTVEVRLVWPPFCTRGKGGDAINCTAFLFRGRGCTFQDTLTHKHL